MGRSGGAHLRGAGRTLGAVLGAGTLLVPAALRATPGTVICSLAVSTVLLAWCALAAAAGGTRERGPVHLVREGLGCRAARFAHGCYLGGIAIGQSALSMAAGEFAADGWAARATAFAVLTVAAAVAASNVALSPRLRKARLIAVLALTAAAWPGLGLLALDAPAPISGGTVVLAVVTLFAWVGLESVVPGARPGTSNPVLGTVAGVAGAALLYAVLLAPGEAPVGSEPSTLVLGWGAATVLLLYCFTNLRGAAGHWAGLVPAQRDRGNRIGLSVTVSVSFAALVLSDVFSWSVGTLLIGPGVATLAIYVTVSIAAFKNVRSTVVERL